MSKEKFERNKPHCNIGTIGHVDHDQRDQWFQYYNEACYVQIFLQTYLYSTKLTKIGNANLNALD